METLFIQVLNMSITAAAIILVIIPIRLLLRRAPKLFSYVLWGTVLFRLLCPVSFTSEISVLKIADAINGPQAYTGWISAPQQPAESPSDVMAANNTAETMHKGTAGKSTVLHKQTQQNDNRSENRFSLWITAWLAGIAVMLGCSLLSMIRLRRRLVGAARFRDNIYLADHITSPFVYGLIRPKIYLPSALAETERDYIILHEQIHIRRKDHLIKLLAFLILAVHWFNPFVWLAFYLSEKDMEMSCDEAVIQKLGDGIRAEYSSSLLRLAAGRRTFDGTLAAFGESDTASRIKHVMEYKKPAAIVLISAVIILVAAVVAAGSNPAKGTDEKDAAENKISTDEAAKILKDYLVNANLCQPEDVPVLSAQKTSLAGKEDLYQFNLQADNTSAETAAEQTGIYYAAACDGSRIYQYDPASLTYKELTYESDAGRFLRLEPSGTDYAELYFGKNVAIRSNWMQTLGFDDDYAHQMQCAFIVSMTKDTIEVDVAEYLELTDTERMRELNLTEHDLPDGYHVHNPDTDTVTWKLDEHTQYLFVDWGGDFTPDGPGYILTKNFSLFQTYLKPYGSKPRLPFFFQVEDGVVKLLVEKPFA